MGIHNKKIWYTVAMIAACFITNICFASSDPPFIKSLKGSSQIKAGDSVIVRDENFYDPSMVANLVKPYYEKNIVTLRFNEDTALMPPNSFTLSVRFNLSYIKYRVNGDSVSVNSTDTLTVTYNGAAGGVYNVRSSLVFDSAQRMKITINSISSSASPTTPTSALLGVMVLDVILQPYSAYKFSCSGPAIKSLILYDTTIALTGELNVKWANRIGADQYDVEWSYIDPSALLAGNYYKHATTVLDTGLLFKNNATRVSTSNIFYNIPMLFPDTGTLFIRVRPVLIKPDGSRIAVDWSSDTSAGLGIYNFYGHQPNISWQSSVSFAEDGKRKAVVQYFDGSLRSRQTVTKDNTTKNTVVAETYYDKQGRPVIQVLPAPSLKTIIQYTRNFNRSLSGGEYDKSIYDTLINASDYCSTAASPMNDTAGAAGYYSQYNIVGGVMNYVPDADGFVFTQTEYTQDNTGRISRQGGVGETFKLGYGHETKYSYGSPDQKELDALFGTEVGDASHYFKNAVRDANGQYSVSYVDMHGRTIATALAGDSVAALNALPSYPLSAPNITETLSDPLSAVIKNNSVIESHKSLIVTSAGSYDFHYSLSPESLQKENCSNTSICYDCLYDLEITITDDCNNQKMPRPFDTVIRKFSLNSIDTSCTPATAFDVSFSLFLQPGNYEVTKTLTLSQYGEDYYKQNVFLKNNSCTTEAQFITLNRNLFFASRECVPTCESCTASVGEWPAYRSNYMLLTGIATADTATYRNEAWTSYQEALADCSDLCNSAGITDPDDMRLLMLQDVTAPFGQYANPDSLDTYSMFSILVDSVRYKKTGLIYYDDFGIRDTVYDDRDGLYKIPQQLDSAQFARKFKSSWATTLLPFHPEYCKLLRYEMFKTSQEWDRNFEKTTSYSSANTAGYLNPASVDPALTGSVLNSTEKSSITNALSAYTTLSGINVSMITMAVIMTKCDTGNVACRTGCVSATAPCGFDSLACTADQDMAWNLFKAMYLAKKHDVINQDIIDYSTICNSYASSPLTSAQTLITGYRYPHFYPTAINYGSSNGFNSLTSISTAAALRDTATARMNAGYQQNCQAYASLWMKDLSRCTAYNADSVRLVIIPRLVTVCTKGSDLSHPFGAREVSPANDPTAQFSSFDEVIDDYNAKHGITKSEFCNADVISAPEPYFAQTSFTNATVFSKPDSCTCSKINGFYSEYTAVTASYTSFSDYMLKHYQTVISNANLDTLRNRCNNSYACKNLPQPIVIPPILQCYSGGSCKTCNEVNVAYQSFANTYGDPTYTPVDTIETQRNRFFENYMSNRLGFYKLTWEYLDFLDSCYSNNNQTLSLRTVPPPPSGTCISCDTLRAMGQQYLDTVSAGKASKTQMEQVILSKLQTKGISANLQSLQSAMATCNAEFDKNIAYTADANAVVFQGTVYDNNLNIGDTLAGGGVSSFTIESWANFQNANGQQPVLYYTTKKSSSAYLNPPAYDFCSDTAAKGYYIYVDEMASHKYLYAYFSDSASKTSYMLLRCTDSIIAGKWYHITITRTGNSYTDFKIYLNGQLKTTVLAAGASSLTKGNITPIPKTVHTTAVRGLMLGENSYTGAGNPVTLKNVRLYKRALSATEIAADYIECDGLPSDTTALKFWAKLNEGTGVPKDYSIYNTPAYYKLNQTNCTPSTAILSSLDTAKHWTGKKGIALAPDCLIDIDNVLCSFPVSDSHLLCGNTQPAFIPVDPNTITNCSDSSFYAASIGMEQYRAYKDSITNNFDSLYRAKCMQAYKFESFTVTHAIREYHYTLYYYDQAGNLVKTIPPQGVNKITRSTWLDSVKTFRNNNNVLVPTHYLATNYRYNTLNQVVAQFTPDASRSDFYYDRLGRLILSQNAKQKPFNSYSYTKYDILGRITEVGQTTYGTAVSAAYTRVPSNITTWFSGADAFRAQITKTVYDAAYVVSLAPNITQYNLRNRVSWTAIYDTAADANAVVNFTAASFYTYDIHGNVDTLLQDYGNSSFRQNSMNYNNVTSTASGNRWKKLVYNYDLISGKVNSVIYQPGMKDVFYHRYTYDAENRLTDVETSSDSIYWEHDASYFYYKHGPLARAVIGDQQVQGIDYAYTLQGWLKGVNSTTLDPSFDMGGDGTANSSKVARDAFGFALNYFGTTDYVPVNTTKKVWATGYNNSAFRPLYNGNIASMQVNIPKLGSAFLYQYTYDQLNRIVGMQADTTLNTSINTWSPLELKDYKERVSYDANGNILNYMRRGKVTAGTNPSGLMDSLNYKYYYTNTSGNRKWYDPGQGIPSDALSLTNKLAHVDDNTGYDSYFTEDIDDQDTANYAYDEIGNLIKDTKEGITGIEWTVYGKIKKITKTGGATIEYRYDASGNRIWKKAASIETWYVRDASGNVMSIYTYNNSSINSGALSQTETDLYGSSRLGMLKPNINVQSSVAGPAIGTKYITTFTRGNKIFELSNHLGNVLVTVSDKKIPVAKVTPNQAQVSYYTADVLSATDYYPFGMSMPRRDTTFSGSYRYKFNGKELDKDIQGADYDYGFRIYDPRTGRFLSVDPLTASYPWNSTFAFAENDVIRSIDLDGLEHKVVIHWVDKIEEDGSLHISKTSVSIDQNECFDGWGQPSSVNKSSGSVFALTETYYYLMSDNKLYKGTDLLENTNVNTVNPPPSAQYDYTTSGDAKQHEDDKRWAGYNPIKWARLITRNIDAPDFAITIGDFKMASLALVVSIPGMAKSLLKAEGVAVEGVNSAAKIIKNGESIVEQNYTRVGRWMSKTEYEIMKNTNVAQEGGGGVTFASTEGPDFFRKQVTPGSVYVEYDVPTNSLLNNGDGSVKTVGPSANTMTKLKLKKQGGEILPSVKNISNIIEIKN